MVMVDDRDFGLGRHALDRGGRLSVDDDDLLNVPAWQVLGLNEIEILTVEGEEGPDVAVDSARQDWNGARIQPVSGPHGRDGVEVGLLVSENERAHEEGELPGEYRNQNDEQGNGDERDEGERNPH